jgi:hypothetical protein
MFPEIYTDRCDTGANLLLVSMTPVPEFIDPVFAKTSPKRSFSLFETERFGLVGSINSGTGGQYTVTDKTLTLHHLVKKTIYGCKLLPNNV